MNRGYPLSAYRETPKDIYPNQEVQIYTWRDASLKEIGGLLKDVVPAAREPGSILSFSIVFLDKNGDFDIKQVGRVFASKPGPDDNKTLNDLNFVTGDFLDIAVLPSRGNVSAPSGVSSSGTNERGGAVGSPNERDRGKREGRGDGDRNRDRGREVRRDNTSGRSSRNDSNHDGNNSGSNKRIRYS